VRVNTYCSNLIHTLSLDNRFKIYPTQRMALEQIGRRDQNGAEAVHSAQAMISLIGFP
jgi:hypothetical protein